jgi:hypothetical protein
VGQLDDEGCAINFHSGLWIQEWYYLYDHKHTNIRDTVVLADVRANSKFLHFRLGHMSEYGMEVLISKGSYQN